jgi:hypothetical protein
MRFGFRTRLRHPLFPDLPATPAEEASANCTAIAGTYYQLAATAARVRPRRAVFVLTHPGQPFLSDSERDDLWTWYQVPVFGLLVDRCGRIAGYECEAQSGMHLVAGFGNPVDPGFLESTPCACGRKGDRLMPARTLVTANVGD